MYITHIKVSGKRTAFAHPVFLFGMSLQSETSWHAKEIRTFAESEFDIMLPEQSTNFHACVAASYRLMRMCYDFPITQIDVTVETGV